MAQRKSGRNRTRGRLDAALRAAGIATASAGAAAAGWVAYSRWGIDHNRALAPAIEAERRRFLSPSAGMLEYYLDRNAPGRPLALLHSVNAAASSHEMQPLFDHYRSRRPVYALDLPGFGFSERLDRAYSPELYSLAILDWLEDQIDFGEPVDVVALSLSAEFAARAARRQPELFRSLTLISPTGFGGRSRSSERLYRWLSAPPWSQALYDTLVSPPAIRYFLNKSFEGPVPQAFVRYCYDTSHRPGARFAPLYFISGQLFTPNVQEIFYEKLSLPVLVVYDRDGYVTFDRLPELLRLHDNWSAVRIPGTRGLPQFEKLPETAQALDRFWEGLPVDDRDAAASRQLRDPQG